MSEDNQLPICPICYERKAVSIRGLSEWPGIRYECLRCGKFDIDMVLTAQTQGAWYNIKHLVSAWVRRENKAGKIPVIAEGANFQDVSSPEWWSKKYQYLGIPETTGEKLNALLIAFGEHTKGNYRANVAPQDSIVSEIGAKDIEEVEGLTILLSQAGYLNPLGNSGIYQITVHGWLRIDELRKNTALSNSAFVAMWFSDLTVKYRSAVIAAVEYCGYKPVVIDQQEYNDFIMNQVVSSIKQSRFLIADFTSRPETKKDGRVKNGVRGGVYWEAGMAYGLGKTVIHTCEDSVESRSRVHFDVHQYNTIFWKPDELSAEIRSPDQNISSPNFSEKLVARILATVGRSTGK